MKSLPLSTLFSLFLSWKILQSVYLTEAEYLYYSGCNSSFTYTPGSVFEQNLNQALTSLVSNSSEYSVYSSITVGKSPDTVYGVVQCFFPRFSAENCQICIKTAATEIRQNCPTQKNASMVYDRCSIEYFPLSPVNTSFPTLLLCENIDYAVEPVLFNLRLRKLFDNLSFSAESDDSKIAVGNISIRSDKNIYGLVQCIADLENGSCFTCLQFIFNYTQRCNLKVGVRFYSMNCFLRYEIYPFFQASVQLSPPHISPSPASLLNPNSTPTASTNATNPTGKKNSTKTIVVVMTVVTALLVIAIFCTCIVRRNAKKKRADGSLHEGGSFHEDDSSSIRSFFIGVKSIQAATENFSDKYKLGSGGFGTVYKAWEHWSKGTALELMDPTMGDEWPRHEALKCIQMGLLCVQEAAANRPKMSEVVLILDGYAVSRSMPSRPGFFISEESDDSLSVLDFQLDEFTTKESHQSVNQVTITELNPRD
ncbi:hypothetical protein FEM48_Zijuj04G0085300 [Ziziphus jujuba var. spinosa]|uniref:Gnk2-homologous domain-containing protein n=1 Tax=Ziziphus jujuba var. spinosa TaxID=714518 RepID=A0A978VIV1_ZIZJJ|nr:hypothetical protein FEM48_Zijuj04G0085300 [Ziziphus jujuba var. spinosa]